jgi:hypothetical protein
VQITEISVMTASLRNHGSEALAMFFPEDCTDLLARPPNFFGADVGTMDGTMASTGICLILFYSQLNTDTGKIRSSARAAIRRQRGLVLTSVRQHPSGYECQGRQVGGMGDGLGGPVAPTVDFGWTSIST